jgi:hypothetical protein
LIHQKALAASGLSTAIIHYCVTPYVSKVRIAKKDIGTPNPLLYIHTLSFLGNDFETKARANQLESCTSRMFANVKLLDSKRHFFLHDALIQEPENHGEFSTIWENIQHSKEYSKE